MRHKLVTTVGDYRRPRTFLNIATLAMGALWYSIGGGRYCVACGLRADRKATNLAYCTCVMAVR